MYLQASSSLSVGLSVAVMGTGAAMDVCAITPETQDPNTIKRTRRLLLSIIFLLDKL